MRTDHHARLATLEDKILDKFCIEGDPERWRGPKDISTAAAILSLAVNVRRFRTQLAEVLPPLEEGEGDAALAKEIKGFESKVKSKVLAMRRAAAGKS